MFLIAALVPGCGSRGPDLNRAKAAVKTALNQWKSAAPAEKLNDIAFTDPDWQMGYLLLDYELISAAALPLPQQGPRVVVLLKLQDAKGKKSDKEVAYEVTQSEQDPKLRIGRDAFHQ